MRISDWSSDVCSSDLRKVSPIAAGSGLLLRRGGLGGRGGRFRAGRGDLRRAAEPGDRLDRIFELEVLDAFLFEILGGDRKSVVEGKRVSVRVDLGGRRYIKKKKIQ